VLDKKALDALGVPQIELAFFDDKEAVHEALTELPWHRVVKARSAGFSQTREEGLLEAVPAETRTIWLEAIAEEAAEAPFSRELLGTIKEMPIFASMDENGRGDGSGGAVMPLSKSKGDLYCMPLDGNVDEMLWKQVIQRQRDNRGKRVERDTLLRRPRTRILRNFFEALGVRELRLGGLLKTHTLPQYMALSRAERENVLSTIDANFEALREDPEMVDILERTPLVECSDGKLRCAKDLFDPRLKILARIFSNDWSMLPPTGTFRTDRWLSILSALGMKDAVTPEALLLCATQVEAMAATMAQERDDVNASWTVRDIAEDLTVFLVRNLEELYDVPMLTKLAKIAFVPAEIAFDVGSLRLVRFQECCLGKDRLVAWAVKPVLPSRLTPAAMAWPALGLESSVSISTVVENLARMSRMASSGAACPDAHVDLVESASRCFARLQQERSSLGRSALQRLQSMECIPVGRGGSFASPSRVFLVADSRVSPFIHQLPPEFGPVRSFLCDVLGVCDAPNEAYFEELLKELRQEYKACRLNPNELKAILRILAILADSRGSASALPTETSELADFGACLCADDASIATKLRAAGCTDHFLLHPSVPRHVHEALKVPLLSTAILEQRSKIKLATDAELDGFSSSSNSTINVRERIRKAQDALRSESVYKLVQQYVCCGDAERAMPNLSGMKLLPASVLETRLVWRKSGKAITGATGEHMASFADEADSCIWLSLSDIVAGSSLITMVAYAFAHVVQRRGAGRGDLSRDAMILRCILHSEMNGADPHRSLAGLGVSAGDVATIMARRGRPGVPVFSMDSPLLSHDPAHRFCVGEICAVSIPKEGGDVLVYAIVEKLVSVEQITGISTLQVALGNRIDNVASTDVFSFGKTQGTTSSSSSKSRRAHAKAPSPSPSPLVNQSLQPEENQRVQSMQPDDAIRALNRVLRKANVGLDAEPEKLLAKNLSLQTQLRERELQANEMREELHHLTERVKTFADANLCKICFTNIVDRILVPSAKAVCQSCVGNLRGKCPFTRQRIEQVLIFSPEM
jgi:hypothetical protein